eukprot:g8281.t1
MGRVRRCRVSCLLLLASCVLSGQHALGQDGQQGEPAGQAAAQQKKKAFDNMRNKPARDYDGVDPSFKSTLEGSMTGGQAQVDAETKLAEHTHGRLESLLRGARTDECRDEIIKAYQRYMGAQALERSLPFEGEKFTTQCRDPNTRPEVPETGLINPEEVRLAYVILAHDNPAQTIRLVNALDDTSGRDRTWFVIHIDTKAEDMQKEMLEVFMDRPNVIVMEEDRLDVAWGGFNVVQASLNAVAVALEREIPFHWLWILSGTTYPIASNDAIRLKLASHHPESIFMEVKPSVHKPASTTWHYFVECDSALHRIGRNLNPRGLDMHVGSQWLAMPPSAARWLMEDRGLVPKYREYAKHIVVADENFLPTLMKNSPYCANLVASNLVHVQFDRYEHTLDREDRRLDKCLMPNPDHCGRSPATMTLDYLSVLEHSSMLFARKFDPNDTEMLDVLDKVRAGEQAWRRGPTFDYISIRSASPPEAAGEEEEKCLSLNQAPTKQSGSRAEATLEKCNGEDPRQFFKLGPCSSDGDLELGEGGRGYMKSTRGAVSGRAPSCSIMSLSGACLDLLGEAKGYGAPAIAFKCHNRWNQFFSFGEGALEGHLLSTVPSHLTMADDLAGGELCLEGVDEGARGIVLTTAKCSPDRPAQKFSAVQMEPPPRPAPKQKIKVKKPSATTIDEL